MAWRSRLPELGFLVGAAVVAQACAQPRAARPAAGASGECRERIIVTFADAVETATVGALAASTGVELDVVSRLLPATYVLDMTAADCGVAVERMRGAVGVRAVDPDSRRQPHPQ
jgi:hypothetical protein